MSRRYMSERVEKIWFTSVGVGLLVAVGGGTFAYDMGTREGERHVNSEYRIEFERTVQPSIKIGEDCGAAREVDACFAICDSVTGPWWDGTECKRAAARSSISKAQQGAGQ